MTYLKIRLIWACFIVSCICSHEAKTWGFFAHKLINRHAVFSLPKPLFSFYRYHIYYMTERSTNPDKRRGIVEGENVKHFIDLEYYRETFGGNPPKNWFKTVEKVGKEFLDLHGIAPWNVIRMQRYLTEAFKNRDVHNILKISADVAHYIADCNVPLHTTKNYNGQLSDQHGIHGLWETRLPELFHEDYDLFVGRAEYCSYFSEKIWNAISYANSLLGDVFKFEKEVSKNFKYDKYSHEMRGNSLQKVYSYEFAKQYHEKLNGMVEKQLKSSIKMVSDFLYTCWVDAGSPELALDIAELKNILEEDKVDENQKKVEFSRECD